MDADAKREFREFVAARSTALFRSAYLLTGQREAAEDLLQGALAKVARRWSRIRLDPEPYTRRVLYHDQVSRWRLRSWRREAAYGELPDAAAPGDHAATTDLRLALAGALSRLTARQRAVVVLRYVEDPAESAGRTRRRRLPGRRRTSSWSGSRPGTRTSPPPTSAATRSTGGRAAT
jgi:DNA-directed RNA polymerase specialized sigma24 family protein